ncbi:MAG: hypothetical protein WD334_07180 [Chitinophagales bacterium]
MPKVSFAQFTYVEGGFGINNATIGSATISEDRTSVFAFNINAQAVFRPIRNLGVGIGFGYPIYQRSKFGFSNAPTTGISSFYDGFRYSEYFEEENRYVPQEFDYTFKQGIKASIFARVFFETYVNVYADVRLSYSPVKEKFVFKREYAPPIYFPEDDIAQFSGGVEYGEVPARDIDYNKTHHLLIPGFSTGIMPHVTDHLFLDINIGFDLWIFGQDKSFEYQIPFQWSTDYSSDPINGNHEYVTLSSQARGVRPSFVLNVGLGYYF